jgi:SAM-dependent methyltransferase
MSGFAANWLALRESADRNARNRDVLAAVRQYFESRQTLRIVDLGCGTGANLRAFAATLPVSQHWRLVDDDTALLAAARTELRAWAADHSEAEDRLELKQFGRHLEIAFEKTNLAIGVEGIFEPTPGLATATAFFDLVSPAWIAGFCRALAAGGLPLYAVLTYDGSEKWTPPHAADAAVLAAFHSHQGRDKGFGPAAGPHAAALLRENLQQAGYEIVSGASPWLLDAATDPGLIAALVEGTASAVAETGLVPEADRLAWRSARLAAHNCAIGHVDLFAWPRN